MDLADAAVRWSTVISQCDHLIAIHGRRETRGRRWNEFALNRAVVVMAVAAWQAAAEDMTTAAVDAARAAQSGSAVGRSVASNQPTRAGPGRSLKSALRCASRSSDSSPLDPEATGRGHTCHRSAATYAYVALMRCLAAISASTCGSHSGHRAARRVVELLVRGADLRGRAEGFGCGRVR